MKCAASVVDGIEYFFGGRVVLTIVLCVVVGFKVVVGVVDVIIGRLVVVVVVNGILVVEINGNKFSSKLITKKK